MQSFSVEFTEVVKKVIPEMQWPNQITRPLLIDRALRYTYINSLCNKPFLKQAQAKSSRRSLAAVVLHCYQLKGEL